MRRAAALAALGLALVLPASVSAEGEPVKVGIAFAAFEPAALQVLSGDTITWSNDSVRRHTITADDGSFGSEQLSGGQTFSHRFDGEGTVGFYCTVHPFMRGTVDVRDLLLTAPREPGAPGREYSVFGRSALPAGTPVTLEADTGAGFAPVAHTAVGGDGGFRAGYKPTVAAELRAVADGHQSPSVRLLVLDRTVQASARRRRGGGTLVRARVLPASPGAMVVLQLHLRERFGWWPVAAKRLDGASTAAFHLGPDQRGPARVVLTLADGATKLAVSPELRAGR